jgi:hypothetical protein
VIGVARLGLLQRAQRRPFALAVSSAADLWIMRFADDGHCHAFEEWPFGSSRGTGGDA